MSVLLIKYKYRKETEKGSVLNRGERATDRRRGGGGGPGG